MLADEVAAAMGRYGPELISPTPLTTRSSSIVGQLCSARGMSSFAQGAKWDEENQKWISGTFDTSHERLEAAAMGFDVVSPPNPSIQDLLQGPTTRSPWSG